jgi:diguanylate cyclase (GGDEF)-like protein
MQFHEAAVSKTWHILIIALFLATGASCDWRESSTSHHPPHNVAIMEDPSGKLAIDQIASSEYETKFQAKRGNRMSLGFNRSALWVRIPLSEAPSPGTNILEVAAPWMERVDLYLLTKEGGWRKISTGLDQPETGGWLTGFAFTIAADTPRSDSAYLRLRSVLSLNAGLRLWSESGFFDHAAGKGYVFGALYGVMGAMLLVNLIVLLTTRDRAYLLYILYLLSIMIHQICLQGQILALPSHLWHLVPNISLFISSTLFFFGAAFCRTFLDTKTFAPLVDRLMQGVQASALLLFACSITDQIWPGTFIVHSLALVGPIIAIAAGWKALAQGFRPARAFLLAWIVLLLGSMAWGAWSMGIELLLPLPASTLTFAAALECGLLSLALADRIGVMQRERKMLMQRERRYRQMSITDDLSGLYNARYFWSKLDSEIKHAHDLGQPLGLVLLDVDDFKQFNDKYGHTEGDKVLSELGNLLKHTVRPVDTPCRYGGEEFALVLPGALSTATHEVAERVRNTLGWRVFTPRDGIRARVTASLGTAQLLPGDDAESLVKRADRALYDAKARGKNQTVMADEEQIDSVA